MIYGRQDGYDAYSETCFKTDQDGLFTSIMAADQVSYTLDMVISLDADGFTVGDGTGVANYFNIADMHYTYVAFR